MVIPKITSSSLGRHLRQNAYRGMPLNNDEGDEGDVCQATDEHAERQKKILMWRTMVAFWLLGLCNNYGYVVMLTAAGDIIGESGDSKNVERNCKYMSTGAVLLADIIPCLFGKMLAPFYPSFMNIRISICVILAAVGYILVAFSENIVVSLAGVVATSFCVGLGETSYLQHSSFYDKNVISTWSSGTGAAGVIGSLSYSLLQTLGMRTTLLIMLLIPATTAFSYWILLPKPADAPTIQKTEDILIQDPLEDEVKLTRKEIVHQKLLEVPSLIKYMLPLAAVYYLEYFINQGTFELVNFQNFFLTPGEQYRWLQVCYQVGVFVSRSSVNVIHIKYIWIMTILQAINVIIFTTEVIFYYMPSFWIIVVLTLWEGLLGGGAYVNTFYRISIEIPEDKKQFALAVVSFSDTIGIMLAGITAIYVHNAICNLPLY